MAGIYTTRFGAVEGTAGSIQDVLSPTQGYTWIVRDVVYCNLGTDPAQFILYIAAPAPPYNVQLEALPGVLAGSTHHAEMRQEVLVGETLRATSDASAWICVVTGYRLSGSIERATVLPT